MLVEDPVFSGDKLNIPHRALRGHRERNLKSHIRGRSIMAKHFHTLRHDVWLPYRFSVGPVFNRFYDGLKEEKILGNQCPECGKTLVPARTFCPACFVDMGEWREVSQEGQVISWTLVKDAFLGMPLNPPFIGALIRLDGTDCNLLHLIGGIPLNDTGAVRSRIKPGSRVRAVWNDKKKGHMLDIKYFEPV